MAGPFDHIQQAYANRTEDLQSDIQSALHSAGLRPGARVRLVGDPDQEFLLRRISSWGERNVMAPTGVPLLVAYGCRIKKDGMPAYRSHVIGIVIDLRLVAAIHDFQATKKRRKRA